LGSLGGLVGDLLAELVALTELLAGDLDDVVGVAVGLGEDQRLGHLFAAGEDERQLVAEGAQHGADLVRVHHVAVQLLGGVGLVLVLLLPALRRVRRSRFSTCCWAFRVSPWAVMRVSIS
jgi:hypothetical protein